MLDTIALTLPDHLCRITKPERFSPHLDYIRNSVSHGTAKAVYNPTKADKDTGYKPRLTLFRRAARNAGVSIFLRIEFSAPKLVFGNNFEELRGQADFHIVINILHAALLQMGIETQKETLMAASVGMIHFSKNILLGRHTPCFLLIQQLEKLDLSQKLDLTRTDFRNGGQMVKYHANAYEIALYDKVKDLEQARKYGAKRGAETAYEGQTALFKNAPYPPEVLRIEVRLTSKKLKLLLKSLKQERPTTLESLFSADLSRCVLLHFWTLITDGLAAMMIATDDAASLIQSIRKAFPRKRPHKVTEIVGFLTACQKIGFRGAALALGMKPHQIYRIKADIKALEKQQIQPRFSVLNLVKNELIRFVPLTAADIVEKDLLKAV